MKIGDMVIRRVRTILPGQAEDSLMLRAAFVQRELLGHGIILTKQMGGSKPVHPCITVFYPKTGQIYDIAESLMEVISEVGS